jgi:hypothetical protein
MDSLHHSKHLWCLKRYKEASIDRSKTFVCLLALLPLLATQGKQALARDRSKTLSISCLFAPSCLFALLPFILPSISAQCAVACFFASF